MHVTFCLHTLLIIVRTEQDHRKQIFSGQANHPQAMCIENVKHNQQCVAC